MVYDINEQDDDLDDDDDDGGRIDFGDIKFNAHIGNNGNNVFEESAVAILFCLTMTVIFAF